MSPTELLYPGTLLCCPPFHSFNGASSAASLTLTTAWASSGWRQAHGQSFPEVLMEIGSNVAI